MDTEQLKMVVDLIQQIGVEGKSAFLWWLVLDKLAGPLIGAITAVTLASLIGSFIYRCTRPSLGETVRDLLGIGSPGGLTPSEEREVIYRVKELIGRK